MKYFKFTGEYSALIMAETVGQAVDVYVDNVADLDEKETNYKEVSIDEVASLASNPYVTPDETEEVLEIAKSGTKPELLLIDALLL